jgi:hypothetical protein
MFRRDRFLFGSAINLNLHFHVIVLEGVYLDRPAQGRKPRFVKGESPTDADIAAVVQKVSRRVIRKLRHLGYLEAGSAAAVVTGYDPLIWVRRKRRGQSVAACGGAGEGPAQKVL